MIKYVSCCMLIILLYLLAEDPAQLQLLLNFTNTWCKNWKMKINKDKTKIVHYRKMSISRSTQFYLLGNLDIEIVDKYKYLEIFLDEFLGFLMYCKYATKCDEKFNSVLLDFIWESTQRRHYWH